jgi:hypothetical protein
MPLTTSGRRERQEREYAPPARHRDYPQLLLLRGRWSSATQPLPRMRMARSWALKMTAWYVRATAMVRSFWTAERWALGMREGGGAT